MADVYWELKAAFPGETRLFRGAEDLFEMIRLGQIDDVEDEVGIDRLAPVQDRRQVRRSIERGAFRRHQDQRRQLLFVFLARDPHDPGAFAFLGDPA